MVVGAFPAVKLAALAFRQLSKPIANVIINKAKQSHFFRQYVCMPPAQFYNWVEVKTKMWALNLGKPTNIPQLNETMAIELGANLLGEVIIFTIGSSLLIFEYIRQTNKESKKEEKIQQEKHELHTKIQDLTLKMEQQDAQMVEISRVIAVLESKGMLPKKMLKEPSPSNPVSSNDHKLVSNEWIQNENQHQQAFVSGNYDPRHGLLFKALNLVENEVFYRQPPAIQRKHGFIQNALVYLNYSVHE